jgi:hypothetical protein
MLPECAPLRPLPQPLAGSCPVRQTQQLCRRLAVNADRQLPHSQTYSIKASCHCTNILWLQQLRWE